MLRDLQDDLVKNYIERDYKQAILSFKAARTEDEQWKARKELANTERLATELFGFRYADSLHKMLDEMLEK